MKTMLIIEDSAYFRTVIKKYVSTLDIEVTGEAESGNEGIEKYMELLPDIVTLDLAMEDGSGIEALEKIKKHNPEAVVIVISSTSRQKSVIEQTSALGATKLFDKPVDKDLLVEYLKELTES